MKNKRQRMRPFIVRGLLSLGACSFVFSCGPSDAVKQKTTTELSAYQPGSSMHRVIKQAEWLKKNMPFDKVKPDSTFLTDQEA